MRVASLTMRLVLPLLLGFVSLAAAQEATTASTTAPTPRPPTLALATTVEEGKKQLVATVKIEGKPVADATVLFFAKRSFGSLLLGQDVTLDDGTAAVAFPSDLPGGQTGEIEFIAQVKPSAKLAAVEIHQTMKGGVVVVPSDPSLPRALWAPRAPLVEIGAIDAILIVVWATYLYVVVQIIGIRRGVHS